MNYNIRPAQPNDTKTICQLAEQTWWPTYSLILKAEQISFMLAEIYAVEKIQKQIQTNEQNFLIIEENAEPVAFAAFSPKSEDPEIYKLHKLYCLPKTQGKGYGRILINAVINEVKKAGKHILELNVNRYNKALTFYQKIGFEIAYEDDVPIGPYWMNDYVMKLSIT